MKQINSLPEGKWIFREEADGVMEVKPTGLTTDDLKTLLSERDRYKEALEQIIKWERAGEFDSAVLRIAAEALKG